MDLEHNRQNFTLAFYVCGMFHQQDYKLLEGKAMPRYYTLDNPNHEEAQELFCSYQAGTLAFSPAGLTIHGTTLPQLGVMSKTNRPVL